MIWVVRRRGPSAALRTRSLSSASRMGSHRSTASLSAGAAGLGTKPNEPHLQGLDEILRSQAFHNLCLRQPVSQSLPLGISYDGSRLEENRNDIGARKKKEKVSSDRSGERRHPPGLEADDDQTKKALSDALPLYRVPQQQVGSASRKVQENARVPVEQAGRDDQKAIYSRGEQPPPDVSLRVWRHQAPGEPSHHRKVQESEHDCRENKNSPKGGRAYSRWHLRGLASSRATAFCVT